MAQDFPTIEDNESLALSRQQFADRDEAIRSNFGGTGFPATAVKGQFCLREDLDKLYICTNPVGPVFTEFYAYLSAIAIDALPTPDAETIDGAETVLAAKAGAAVKIPLAMFGGRLTKDLVEESTLIGTELIRGANSTGLERKIAVKELMRLFSGRLINVTHPPYNCVGDGVYVKNGSTTSASKLVEIGDALFKASDVGKPIFLSNAGSGGIRYQSVIESYISPTQVNMVDNALFTAGNQQVMWGTDNSAGMAAALYASRPFGLYDWGASVYLPAGGYICDAQTYEARAAIFGDGARQSVLMRMPSTTTYTAFDATTQPAPVLRNRTTDVDFPIISHIGLFGGRYLQRITPGGTGGLVWTGRVGGLDAPYPQVDPYPRFDYLDIWECGWHGLETNARHSGVQTALNIFECKGIGWLNRSYDINALAHYILGNRGPGMYFFPGGDNCNLMNFKVSYNGARDLHAWLGDWCGANVVMSGRGNQMTNARLQESWGSNMVVNGQRNKFTSVTLDDTACIHESHSDTRGDPLPLIRAGIQIYKEHNALFDVVMSQTVHLGTNYATHGIWFGDNANARETYGRMFVDNPAGTWFANGGSDGNAPQKIGYHNAIHASNSGLLVDGVAVV